MVHEARCGVEDRVRAFVLAEEVVRGVGEGGVVGVVGAGWELRLGRGGGGGHGGAEGGKGEGAEGAHLLFDSRGEEGGRWWREEGWVDDVHVIGGAMLCLQSHQGPTKSSN